MEIRKETRGRRIRKGRMRRSKDENKGKAVRKGKGDTESKE
jgi:hypothetical protein